MRYRISASAILGAIVVLAMAGPGCDGGDPTGQGGTGASTTSNTGGKGGDGGSGGDTGGAGGTTNTGGNGGTGGTGGTGGGTVQDNGVQATDLVSCGGTAKSANFSMVFTLGQSTQNQGLTKSANFQMQGGLIGATAGSSK